MEISDLIIKELNKEEDDDFTVLRKIYAAKNVLSPAEFSKFVKLVEDDPIKILEYENLTFKENTLISKVLVKAKIRNPNKLAEFLIKENSRRTVPMLNSLLMKRCKIDSEVLSPFLSQMIKRNVVVCHLQLLMSVFKGYKEFITPEILKFCSKNTHPICKKIIEGCKMDVEK